jgi:hypothetical protein
MTVSIWLFGIAALAGVFSACVYFWGLWLTVSRLKTTASPYLLGITSLVVRLLFFSVCLIVFLSIDWRALFLYLAIFLAVRSIALMLVHRSLHQGGN